MGNNHICKKCGGIAGWDSYFQSWICTRCGNEEPKPITNGDRIRSMSDEELAMFLQDIWYISGSNDTSNAWWLNWLQEASDGTD